MMNKKLLLANLFAVLPLAYSAQVGINTDDPKTVLHIDASSKTAPNGTDGILIPKIKNFPEENPTTKGILVVLEGNDTEEDNFYFWEGTKWVPFKGAVSKTLDETIYSFNGEGMTDGYFNLTQYNKKDTDNFEILDDKTIQVGKAGTYQVLFSSSIHKVSSSYAQSNYNYYIDIYSSSDTSTPKQTYTGSIGFPLEYTAGSNIVVGFISDFSEGDLINVRGEGTTPASATYTYTNIGNNNLTLTFIRE